MNGNKDIGIGILDIYTQTDLNDLLGSIPEELHEDVYVVSSTDNTVQKFNNFKFKKETPFGCMRNKILAYFRIKNKKNIFLLESNTVLLNSNYLSKVIETAGVFGTWIMTAPERNSIILEDNNLNLHLTPYLNTSFLYMFSGIINQVGYFNEQFVASKGVEVLDYLNRCRKIGVYPPFNYNPTVKEDLLIKENKGNFNLPDESRRIGNSLGLFQHLHGYIPGHNDPKNSSQESVIAEMEKIQFNFAKKI